MRIQLKSVSYIVVLTPSLTMSVTRTMTMSMSVGITRVDVGNTDEETHLKRHHFQN